MKIICSTNMPFVGEAFGTLGEARIVEGRTISAEDVRDAELLAIRSTTKVNEALLTGSRVRFVGTATIGTDHMDLAYLDKAGIRWCHASGCNANSVSEYVTAALLCLAARHGFALDGLTLGVVGVGNVGTRIVEKAHALGMRVLRNDPPRQRRESDGGFVGLDELLATADVVSLHVPLTNEGPDATRRMADAAFFARLKPGAIFLNCARGPVMDTAAVLEALKSEHVSHAVIDTWDGEPGYSTELLRRVELGSPHIAGHSFEGKVMGTVMVYREACDFLGVPADWSVDALLPAPLVPSLTIDAAGRSDEAVLWDAVHALYDIEADDARFRETLSLDETARRLQFDRLRRNYPMRREFRFTHLSLPGASPRLKEKARMLGFQLALD